MNGGFRAIFNRQSSIPFRRPGSPRRQQGLAFCKTMGRDIIAPGLDLHWHVSKILYPRRSNGKGETPRTGWEIRSEATAFQLPSTNSAKLASFYSDGGWFGGSGFCPSVIPLPLIGRGLRSRDGSDFFAQDPVFGVIGFLELELTLQADEQIAGHPETELEPQGDPCADPFFLADHVAELGFADVHGLRRLDLGDSVMDEGVPDECGSGI